VDANIAIAATTFNVVSMTFDLTWDDPNAEVDFYLTDPCGVTHYEPDLYPNITSACCKTDGGDDENDGDSAQHMVVSNMKDGNYQLWVNYEGGDTNVNCTLQTTSAYAGVLSTTNFTLTTPASGQSGGGWPTGVTGPATQPSWYVRKVITISNGQPTSY